MSRTRNPNDCLKAAKGDDVITLHNSVGKHLIFLGASIEASTEPGYKGLAPISFVPPPKDEIGLIAIVSEYSHNYYPFFIKIGWEDGKPNIFSRDSDEPWVPKADKLAQITNKERALSVKIDGEWYVTSAYGVSGNIVSISAGNLICRYLVSEGEESKKLAKEIKQMAVAREEELSAKDKVVGLKAYAAEQRVDLRKKSTELDDCQTAIRAAKDILEKATFGNRENAIEHAVKALQNNL